VTCQHLKQTVCGEEVCGTCYGERLLKEPVPVVKQREPMPTYPCCGKPIALRMSDHHKCQREDTQ